MAGENRELALESEIGLYETNKEDRVASTVRENL